jgi:hypothetical protein
MPSSRSHFDPLCYVSLHVENDLSVVRVLLPEAETGRPADGARWWWQKDKILRLFVAEERRCE